MTVTGHEEEFRRIYEAEATARLTQLTELATAHRDGVADPERLDVMYRQAHTLVGGAGVVGFPAIAEAAERLARRIDAARTGVDPADGTFADEVLAAVEGLRARLAAERGTG